MSKNVLIISSSPRVGGNSDTLCSRFAEGAKEAGNTVEMIRLAGKKIGFCTACYACQKGSCPLNDDVAEILKKMLAADVLVLGTPVYFYTMAAQLKALIDRSVAIYPQIQKKSIYFIMTMADTDSKMFKGTIEALRGFVACCEGSEEKGIVSAAGVYQKGEILRHEAYNQAYEMGKTVE